MENFKTVLNLGSAEIVEKKSRFIANAMPVKSEEEAKAFIEEIKKRYWDARHNVFAYQIGLKNGVQRFSDDGEPQGTAGMPVLNVLTGEDIKNCVIVVTRYFGGTLLGTGGLVRAYGKSAKEALYNAQIAEIGEYCEFEVICDYSLQGKIQYMIRGGQYVLKDIVFTDTVRFVVLVGDAVKDKFLDRVTDISNGKADVNEIRKVKGAMTEKGFIEI